MGKKETEEPDDTSEDTSEEEDVENTSEEDNEEESGNSKEKGKVEKEKEESDEEIIYRDVTKVPKGLQPTFKKMQAAVTRKNQELSNKLDKVEFAEKLLADRRFLIWLDGIQNPGNKKRSRDEDDDYEDNEDEDDDDTPVTRKALSKLLDKKLSKITEPLIEERRERQKQSVLEKQEEFKENNPDWEDYFYDMKSLSKRHPTMDLQELYDLAVSRSLKEEKEIEAKKTKKKANSQKPGKTGSREVPDKKKPLTVREAFNKAKAKLGWGN